MSQWLEYHLNKGLEGYALYYGMYSQEEKYYARLYDYRSVWARIYLNIMSFLFGKIFITRRLFEHEAVISNLPDLHNFSIDAVVVTVIRNATLKDEILASDTSHTPMICDCKFVYILVETNNGQFDITPYMNKHIDDILAFKNITYLDIVNIFANFYSHLLLLPQLSNEITIKACSDNKFDDVIFKGNDIVDITSFS